MDFCSILTVLLSFHCFKFQIAHFYTIFTHFKRFWASNCLILIKFCSIWPHSSIWKDFCSVFEVLNFRMLHFDNFGFLKASNCLILTFLIKFCSLLTFFGYKILDRANQLLFFSKNKISGLKAKGTKSNLGSRFC